MCSQAAMIQLVATGLADAVLTGTPTVSFFHHHHKPYTNFTLDVERQAFPGNAGFGSSPKVNLDRIGDLIYHIYVEAQIPGLGLQYPKAQPVSILKNPTGVLVEPYWVRDIGHALIQNACIFIGGQSIDEIQSEFMFIWEELSGQPGKHLVEMTGNYTAEASLMVASRQPRILYIPLPFWFTQNSGHALPIVSLQFHSVAISLTIRPLASLFKLSWLAANGVGYGYALSDVMGRKKASLNASNLVQPLTDLFNLSNSDLILNLLVTQVYLDQRERSQFADGQFEHLINQHQYQVASVNQTVSATNGYGSTDVTPNIDLIFNHPTFELYVVARLKVRENWTSNEIPEYNDWFNFTGFDDNVTGCPMDPLTQLKLKLNNSDRLPSVLEARYFRLVEPWQWHTNIVSNNCIYSYSFSLQPEDVQPAGSCNLSRIDNAILQPTIDRRCFTGPATVNTEPPPEDGTNPSQNSSVSILVFVQNYNILRFKYGLGGLRFAA